MTFQSSFFSDRQQCDWVKVNQCSPQRQKKCRNVNRQKCETVTKQECKQVWKEINQPYSDQECWDEPVQHTPCERVWVESGYNQKNWVEDPDCRRQNQVQLHLLEHTYYMKNPRDQLFRSQNKFQM